LSGRDTLRLDKLAAWLHRRYCERLYRRNRIRLDLILPFDDLETDEQDSWRAEARELLRLLP
jgi:hypothetical protein